MEQIKHYFAGSNSSEGFYSVYPEILESLDLVYILKGGPGTGKSTLIKKVGNLMMEKGFQVEYIHCSFDDDSLDGLIIPEIKAGIVDGTAPHIVDPKYPGVIDKIVNLGECRNDQILQDHRDKIIELSREKSAQFSHVYEKFADAKAIHEQKEEIYIRSMDFKQADQITEKLKNTIFADTINPEQGPYKIRRFFGAATPSGPVHFVDNLTADLNKRYIIKGRSGSGKSTLMKKIGEYAEEKGLSVHYYLCAFHPESVDMVVIPSLDTAIIDGTAPHVIEATRDGDEIIDMFELCIDPQVEVDRKQDIKELDSKYKQLMRHGTQHLLKAKESHDEIESFYVNAMNFELVNEKTNEIADSLLKMKGIQSA